MAVTYGSQASASGPFTGEITWTHSTVAGDFLIVFLPYFELVNHATYNGVSMIPVEIKKTDGQFFWLGCYCLPITAALAGANTVAAGTPNLDGTYSAASIVLQGVDPTAYYLSATVAREIESGTNALPTLTIPRNAGELTVAAAWCLSQQTITQGEFQTVRVDIGESTHGQLMITTSEVEANTFSFGGSCYKIAIGLSLRPVGAGGIKPIPAENTFWEKTLEIGTLHCAAVQTAYEADDGATIYAEFQGTASGYYDFPYHAFLLSDYHTARGETATATMYYTAAIQSLDTLLEFTVRVLGTPYQVFGWRNFTRGLLEAYRRTGNVQYRTDLEGYRDNASYSASSTPAGPSPAEDYYEPTAPYLNDVPRELSYSITADIMAARAGGISPRTAFYATRLERLWTYWTEYFDDPMIWVDEDIAVPRQMSPFMIAATMGRASIEDWEISKDARTIPMLEKVCNYMWQAYDTDNMAIPYSFNPASEHYSVVGSPDVNNMIAPLYAWVAWQTGSQTQMDRADMLFGGAALNASWVIGKPFHELHTWTHDGFFRYRNSFYAPTGNGSKLRRALKRGRR
jgi:hypothetical protein